MKNVCLFVFQNKMKIYFSNKLNYINLLDNNFFFQQRYLKHFKAFKNLLSFIVSLTMNMCCWLEFVLKCINNI